MLQPVIRITIYQNFSDDELSTISVKPLALQIYSVVNLEAKQSWEEMIQTAEFTIPKGVEKIGYVEYSYEDYFTMRETIFTKNIETAIKNNIKDRYLTIKQSPTTPAAISLINKSRTINTDKNGIDIRGYRINPLIKRQDMIIIQCGYLTYDKNGAIFSTIDSGNVGLSNKFSQKLPDDLNKVTNNLTFSNNFNIDNRWKAYNRGILFKGYITSLDVDNDNNIVVKCQDYMYLFTKATLPNSKREYNPGDPIWNQNSPSFKSGWNVNNIILDCLDNITNSATLPKAVIQPTIDGIPALNLKGTINVDRNQDIRLGKIIVPNQIRVTVYDVLRCMNEDYGINVFFRPNTDIICASPFVYNSYAVDFGKKENELTPSVGQEQFLFITGNWTEDGANVALEYLKSNTNIFIPKVATGEWLRNTQNVISTNLEFRRTEDNIVGGVVKSIYLLDYTSGDDTNDVTTKDARKRKKPKELSKHVGNVGGTQYTWFYLIDSSKNKIKTQAELETEMVNFGNYKLRQTNYTGLYGSFTTYGYPYVNMCDVITFIDLSNPERNGRYYVKSVTYMASTNNGLTQEIYIDYRIPDTNDFQ